MQFESRALDAGLFAVPLPKKAMKLYQDGPLRMALFHADVEMRLIIRRKKELFHETIEKACRTEKFLVAVNGSFMDSRYEGKIGWANRAWHHLKSYKKPGFKKEPFSPGKALVPMAFVVEDGKKFGTKRMPKLMYLANRFLTAPHVKTYQFGIGDPPRDSKAAMAGLGPVILDGKKYSSKSHYFYRSQAGEPSTGGNVFIARWHPPQGSSHTEKILVVLMPHAGKQQMHLNAIRDKLAAAKVSDAVFLDGGSSVMMYLLSKGATKGTWVERQSYGKDRVTEIGVGFRYDP